ncbi:isochorismatase family protein [Actinomadura sp. ATCC 31491]|uniref:Isochorismatase family protein n=1 Tax=Actinomadura luzonensis TaxID=2805427 RepID=A0ABT0FT63_9ACTN|nr:isochorismatase family protein [Actinomadura luzonensis]MCK2215524.1 isochorismatase family protein [Actinomadura luzonensis]
MTVAPPPLDPRTTALLVLDCQPAILASLPDPADTEALLSRLAGTITDLRAHGASVVHVRLAFTTDDWTAVPPDSKPFAPLALGRLMHDADPATGFHPRLSPEPGDRRGCLRTLEVILEERSKGSWAGGRRPTRRTHKGGFACIGHHARLAVESMELRGSPAWRAIIHIL